MPTLALLIHGYLPSVDRVVQNAQIITSLVICHHSFPMHLSEIYNYVQNLLLLDYFIRTCTFDFRLLETAAVWSAMIVR